jgi:eukaryotic-like serine/threonine-protein kinase
MPTQTLTGRYRLVAEIGRGGMGVVWEAFDELLHRSVAVKEIHYPAGVSGVDRDRLAAQTLREARAVAAIDTFAAVRVYDVVEQDGKPWLVMELVRGRTLSDVIRERGALPGPEVARLGLEVLTALEAAHEAGVLHRDVKPSNVLVGDDGRIALTDFGIATVDSDPSDTTSGVIVGSPSYVSPERAQGVAPSPSSDLWSLGATLWTAAEGRAPYQGATAFLVLSSVANEDPPPCAHCDDELRSLLTAMMSRSPDDRPPPAEIRARLKRIAVAPTPTRRLPAAMLDAGFDRTTVLRSDPAAEADPTRSFRAPPAVSLPPSTSQPDVAPATVGRHRRRWLPVAMGAGVIAAVVAVAIVMSAGSPGSKDPSSQRHPKVTTASHHPSASTRAQQATVPAGWKHYRDPQYGWSVAIPKGWQRSQTSGGTQFTDPAGGRYVLFGTRYPAGASAIGAWRSQERAFRSSHSGYQRLQLATVSVPGASDAADWQFSYVDGGASLRALDRGMVFGDRGYGIYFQTHSDQWESSAGTLATMINTYRPGRTGA